MCSAVVAVPIDDKSGVLLEGRYQDPDSPVRTVRPSSVMDELLATVFTVRQYVLAAVALVGVATLATIVLVFLLSIRLIEAEVGLLMSMLSLIRLTRLGPEVDNLRATRADLVQRIRDRVERRASSGIERIFTEEDFNQ